MDDKLRTKLERLKEKKGSEREAGLLGSCRGKSGSAGL